MLLADSISPNEFMMCGMIAKQEGPRLFLPQASVARKANRYFIILFDFAGLCHACFLYVVTCFLQYKLLAIKHIHGLSISL